MAFLNRVRLPIQLHSAQFPSERKTFRKANGETKVFSAVVRKTYELETDYMPEAWHQRLQIALSHDTVNLEGEKYVGGISQDGDYQIEWIEGVLHYPAAKANSKVQVTPFDATNSNCQTCEEASQLSLQDDVITGLYGANLQESGDYTLDVSENDTICCYPAVFSLTSYNSDYLASCSIDPATGLLSMELKDDLVSASGIVLATYRVTCPNGGYDEADVTGTIDGSIEGCLAPSDVEFSNITTTTATASWTETEPGSDYYWELYEGSVPAGSPVQTGSVSDDHIDLTGLTPGMTYAFQVRTVCYGSNSNFIGNHFETVEPETSCGSYQINNSGTGDPGFKVVGYVNCAGGTATAFVFNQSSAIVCALENSPGDPVSLTSTDPNISITYLGPC